jgi:hypothetical protein
MTTLYVVVVDDLKGPRLYGPYATLADAKHARVKLALTFQWATVTVGSIHTVKEE